MMLSLESLPPLGLPSDTATEEMVMARDFLEHAVLLSISTQDKDSFSKYISSLKPYYAGYR